MGSVTNPDKYQDAVDNFPVREWLEARSEIVESGCREWRLARMKSKGYAIATVRNPHTLLAHRLAYWAYHGPIPGDLVVDHICQNRGCINPDHLRLLTRAENVALAHSARKTHCTHGHALTPENVYEWTNAHGLTRRACRTCNRAKQFRRTKHGQAALAALSAA